MATADVEGARSAGACRVIALYDRPTKFLVAPRFGLGNAIFFVLLGQLLSAAVIDHFGLFNAPEARLSLLRVCGLLVMAAGIWLTQVAAAK